MSLTRMMPPASAVTSQTITVHTRTYTCAVGSTIDVPDFDGKIMEANGWVPAAAHGGDTTANRPTNPFRGMTFLDTTVGAIIRFDGKVWRNGITGAAV